MRSRKLKPVINKLAKKYGLTEEQVIDIVESPYGFTEETINNLKLDDITEEEFSQLKTNFIYKYIGKLYINIKTLKFKE